MFKAIFWDNDGVLVDTEILYMEASRQVLQEVGIELTDELYIEHFLINSSGMSSITARYNFSPTKIEMLQQKRNEIYSKLLCLQNSIINNVAETLHKLHQQFKMAIVTSSRREHFDLIHRQTDILMYFDFVLAKGDYEVSKPHPAPYLKALERSGLSAKDCLVIEDSERGLASAKAAGLTCWVIPSTLTKRCKFNGADAILKDITEVSRRLYD